MARTDIPQLIALTLITANTSGCWFFNCGDTTTETPVSVTDWAVTMEGYADIVELADSRAADSETSTGGIYGYTGTPWAERDDEARCQFACAFASSNLDVYSNSSYYRSIEFTSCELEIPTDTSDGVLNCSATILDRDVCVGGRRPLAWDEGARAVTSVAGQLAGMAVMERVSVTAFVELAAQLEARAAPAALVERCRAAAQDERRHVDLLVGLGATEPAPAPAPAPASTSLLDIAVHNATEGCVTETWAALLARHQSQHAPDVATREVMSEIAEDEARHAQLAWDLHDWLCAQLDAASVAAVEAARADAVAALCATATRQAMAVPASVRAGLGLPEPRVARALAADFGRRLAAA